MTRFGHLSCWLCLRPGRHAFVICDQCIGSLTPIVLERACVRCKAPLNVAEICGECLRHRWHFDALWVPFYYDAMAKYLLHHFKFYQHLSLLPAFADLLQQHMRPYFTGEAPELIVPVPLHRWRLWRRGFNQAHELAKRLGKFYDVAVDPFCVKKIKYTRPQALLSASLRRKNLRAGFQINFKRVPQHILLVDDVFTTGTTVNILAQDFKKAGVARVDVLVLFRA